MFDTIVLRKETKMNEYRTPLVPADVKKLINNNFKVYVEESPNRCYKLDKYISHGAIEILRKDVLKLNKDTTLIAGLKELCDSDNLYSFKNLYFAHCYKNQNGSENILNNFKNNNGTLYDLEYLVDDNNRRLVAFGFYAGLMGTLLGIMQFIKKSKDGQYISNLTPIIDLELTINKLKLDIINSNLQINVAIIGIYGRCGKGS